VGFIGLWLVSASSPPSPPIHENRPFISPEIRFDKSQRELFLLSILAQSYLRIPEKSRELFSFRKGNEKLASHSVSFPTALRLLQAQGTVGNQTFAH